MIYNTIMVQFEARGAPEPRLGFAADLARRFDADLIGFSAAEVQPIIPAAEAAVVDGEMLQQMSDDLQRSFDRLQEAFEARMAGSEQATWRSFFARPTACLVSNARAADLIVAAQPDPGFAGDSYQSVDLGELILAAGRPVLVMSEKGEALEAKRILVAWKDTREARRAVADAMPFLVRAEEVLVATMEDHERSAARSGLADVVRYLMRHGVKARLEVVGHERANDIDTLALLAENIGADLIVAGAYGHSRLREWAFGGVTRSLLRDGRFNRFLSN